MVMIPRDVLDSIFLLIATDPGDEVSERLNTILDITYVCKWWRQVALEHSVLWNHVINFDGHFTQIQELLRRSRQSLLEFRGKNLMFCTDGEDYEVLQLVAEHTTRLSTFNLRLFVHVEDDNSQMTNMIHSSYLSRPLPNLKYLRLEAIRPIDYSPNDDVPTFYATSVSFLLDSPRLERVELKGWFFPLSPSSLGRLSNLQELEVREIKEPIVPTLQSWLQILASLPSLRWLVLDAAIVPNTLVDHSQPLPNTKLSLPKLEMITLNLSLADAMQLLSSLSLPLKCGLKLDCTFSSFGVDQRALFNLLREKIQACQSNHRWDWSVGFDNTLHIVHVLNSGLRSYERPPWRKNVSMPPFPVILLRFGFEEGNRSDFIPFFHSLSSVIFQSSYPSTVQLQLSIVMGESSDVSLLDSVNALARNFHLLPNIENLCLFCDVTPPMLSRLRNSTSPNGVYFPGLRSLTIRGAELLEFTESSTTLINFVKWRKEQGCPIHELIFHECNIDEGYIEAHLGDIVELGMMDSYNVENDLADDASDSSESE